MNINEFTDEDLIQDEIVLDGDIPENIPLEEVPIEPEGPESLLDPKYQVYVPKATTYRPGIASYDGKDFLVDPKGKVSLIVDLNDVKNKTDTALENSQQAVETADEAKTIAGEAKSIAEDALEQVIIGEGTKIYEDGVLQSSINVDKDIQEQFNDIDELIPAQASPENQLADKEFVNSSIATNTANFIGTFADVLTLLAYSGTITNNDYAFVVNSERDFASTTEMNAYNKGLLTNFDYAWIPNGSNYDLYRFDIVEQTWVLKVTDTAKADVTLNTAYNRYKAVIVGNTVSWVFEYTLNNSSFTADQWAAINSGITAAGVTQISDLQTNKADKNNATQEIVAKKMTAGVYKVNTAGTSVLDGTEWGLDAFNNALRLVTNRASTDIQICVPQNRSVKFYNGSTNVTEIDKDGIITSTLQSTGFKDGNNANYKAVLPDTTGWTADKTLATTDQINADVSNPNLIINGDFSINQRDLTSYTTNGYTVDRWYNDGLTINAQYTNRITINSTSQNVGYFLQSIPLNFVRFLGKTITISADVSEITVPSGKSIKLYLKNCSSMTTTTASWESEEITTTGKVSFTVTFPAILSTVMLVAGIRFAGGSGSSITLNYIKVEFGDTATPLIPRPIYEELSLCQAYYRKIKGGTYTGFGTGIVFNKNRVEIFIAHPVSMNSKTPTLIIGGSIRLTQNNATYGTTGSGLTLSLDTNTCTNDSVILRGDLTNDLPSTSGGVLLQANNDATAYIAFDAEVY